SMTSLQVRTNTGASNNVLSVASGQTLTVNGDVAVGLPATYIDGSNAGAGIVGAQTRLATGNTAGTGGSLVVNSGASFFRVGMSRANAPATTDPFTFVDLSGLSNFTFSGTASFRI